MLDGIDGMVEQHPRTGKSHDGTHFLAHLRLVAMHRTKSAGTFPVSELAPVQPAMCILQQGCTICTKGGIAFVQTAVKPDHLLHRTLLFFNTREGVRVIKEFFHTPNIAIKMQISIIFAA